ncbi:hypothetical protein FRC07_012017, partial [Ceratobasidium sp. 392]
LDIVRISESWRGKVPRKDFVVFGGKHRLAVAQLLAVPVLKTLGVLQLAVIGYAGAKTSYLRKSAATQDRRPYFLIKFGDGNWEAPGRYRTHAPGVRYVLHQWLNGSKNDLFARSGFKNKTCTTASYYDKPIKGTRAGTYLKNAVFVNVLHLGQEPGSSKPTEWYMIRPAGTAQQLGRDLVELGTKFTMQELGFNAATAKKDDTNRPQTASWALSGVGVVIRQHIEKLGHGAQVRE